MTDTDTDRSPEGAVDEGSAGSLVAGHDWGVSSSISTSVVFAVARAAGTEPDRLPALYRWIDPDSLNRLFRPPAGGGDPDAFVRFDYAGFRVTVFASGDIAVTPLASGAQGAD